MPSEQAPFGASPIGPSRRQVLAGAGLLAVGGVAGLVPLGGVDGWTPREDAWPLSRYDLANTASTDALPPTDPSVAWSDEALGRHGRTTLVVSPERVYAGGRGLVARSRDDGSEAWTHGDLPSGRLALRGGTLHSGVAEEIAGLDSDVLAVDASTGERGWGVPLPSEVTSLLVADGGVFVGYDGGAAGFDPDTGWRRWRRAGGTSGTYIALHGGDLYATEGLGRVYRFAGRDLLDLPLRSGPSVRWESGPPATEAVGPPVVTGNRVIAGQRVHGGPGVVACRPEDGSVVWTAAEDASESVPVRATGLAVADGVAVAGLLYGRPRDVERGAVVGLDPGDGAVRWTLPLDDRYPTTVAVAGDSVLVGLASPGPVGEPARAFDLDSGTERWRVGLPDEVTAVAPVEGTAFVACRDGSVHALRD